MTKKKRTNHSACRVDMHACWHNSNFATVGANQTCSATEKMYLYNVEMLLSTEWITDALCLLRWFAVWSAPLLLHSSTIRFSWKISKDIVLKFDGRISHKQDAFSPATCEPQQLCGILIVLTYTDAHPDFGHQNFIRAFAGQHCMR